MALHELYERGNALFRKAGVEKPDHERLQCHAPVCGRDDSYWLHGRGSGSKIHDDDARDLIAAHWERLWYELSLDKLVPITRSCGQWHLYSGGFRASMDPDKLTAIYLALVAKYGGDDD